MGRNLKFNYECFNCWDWKYWNKVTEELSLDEVDGNLIMISHRCVLAVVWYELYEEAKDQVHEKNVFKEKC